MIYECDGVDDDDDEEEEEAVKMMMIKIKTKFYLDS
jgi:hypothetical protein